MSDRLAVTPQYLLPKRLLTQFAGLVANMRGGALTHAIIRNFVAKYRVDMSEAAD
ncbi:MAG: phosphatidylserine decarboxylase, partial [Comamonadaceae bacterium]